VRRQSHRDQRRGGGLGWGIGTTEVERVLATQTLLLPKPKTMRANFRGRLSDGVTSKDLILYLIGQHGVAIGTGYAVEYAGPAIRALPIEARLTVCNMSIEFGARSGMIAPDDTTIQFFAGRPYAPTGERWEQAVAHWRALPTDDDAAFDREIDIDCGAVNPQVTWGTSPQEVIGVDERIPDPSEVRPERRAAMIQALAYMGLKPGMTMEGLPIDYAFIGSCTNSRLSDLQAAAAVIRGRKIPESVTGLVVPGSSQVKAAAEAIGLDRIFKDAGFQWRESGCSMCQTLGGDFVPPGRRCISTSNRNFEDRQGSKSRTHLASPAMVAAAAVHGRIVDVRRV
jgi:3-isopropylmalate/(R)-2-methylmalate dehydratase large subunit